MSAIAIVSPMQNPNLNAEPNDPTDQSYAAFENPQSAILAGFNIPSGLNLDADPVSHHDTSSLFGTSHF